MATRPLRFCLVLHDHQPVGNFDGVIEQAYRDSYLPLLSLVEQFPKLKLTLHTSGPLMEWLDERHGEYLDRLAVLVAEGRVEIIGGPFYEPILTMIPARDRIGQIRLFSEWLNHRLGAAVQGMWMPERVWEQSLTSDLTEAGMRYTVLDDFHFKNAGLSEDQLFGHYLTEDDGRLLNVFPGSERLRYLIPFGSVAETMGYLKEVALQNPGGVIVFGDDGEKFGTWPETYKHVYENGWLRSFFEALSAAGDWLQLSTLAESVANVPPVGTIYLPDGSYREMTEWSLPVKQQLEYESVVHQFEHEPSWPRLKRFVRGGFWRNFKVKYSEANEMYSRMLGVSRRLAAAEASDIAGEEIQHARRELYRGQCNCGYWHGAFGGIYLPHLRNALYNHLIAADNLLDAATKRSAPYVESQADDFNFDARQEVRLSSDRLICYLAPAAGGQMYELDVRSICLNLLATLKRRPEAYHRKVLAGANANGSVASIHDRVVFKQEGLDRRIQYDSYERKSLLDHFFANDVTLPDLASGAAVEQGDFLQGVFETRIRKNPERIQVLMSREGRVFEHAIKLSKGVTLGAGGAQLEIAYLFEHLPPGVTLHFAPEFNFAALPAGCDDRYFYDVKRQPLGHLGLCLDLSNTTGIGLIDQWLGIDVRLIANRPTGFWTYPVESVSQSEGGIELVHQSVCVLPHWHIQGDAHGQWSVTLTLAMDTSLAESRSQNESAATASV